jgi:cobalt-zinc-cadmium efflux system membrane fusion protein
VHLRVSTVTALVGALLVIGGCDGSGEPPAGNAAVSPASHTHDLAGETCFICDASKRDAGRLWCREHSRYEDRCWLCQPQLREPDRLYCEEHGLYEDECFLCRPELQETSDASGHDHLDLFCQEHGVPERECAICQPALAASLAPGESLKIRFPSSRSAELAGVETGEPDTRRAATVTRVLAETRYNGNRLAKVTPLAGGVILTVHADLGQAVQPGDVLAELSAPGIARAKGAYLSARAEQTVRREAYEREQTLMEEKISARRDFLEAEAAHRLAELQVRRTHQELLNLGFSEREIARIAQTLDSSSALLVRAPFDGTIIERRAVTGEAVEVGTPLFELADLSTMWLELAVPETQAATLQPGAPIEATFRALPGEIVRGELVWVGPTIDVHTRMVRARAVVPNHAGTLRNGMFGEVAIHKEGTIDGVALPRDALQTIDGSPFVFVRLEDDLYAARRVAVHDGGDDFVTVLAGLSSEERVVLRGGFTMKSEFLKSRLGAGCADD